MCYISDRPNAEHWGFLPLCFGSRSTNRVGWKVSSEQRWRLACRTISLCIPASPGTAPMMLLLFLWKAFYSSVCLTPADLRFRWHRGFWRFRSKSFVGNLFWHLGFVHGFWRLWHVASDSFSIQMFLAVALIGVIFMKQILLSLHKRL